MVETAQPAPQAEPVMSKRVVVLAVILAVLAALTSWYLWRHNHMQGEQTPNIVVGDTSDVTLAGFLKQVDTRCYIQPTYGTGWYQIVKEVKGSQAVLQYGCQQTHSDSAPAYTLATKAGEDWSLISPTNQWLNGLPSCSMLHDHLISKSLEPVCWAPTTSGNQTLDKAQANTQP